MAKLKSHNKGPEVLAPERPYNPRRLATACNCLLKLHLIGIISLGPLRLWELRVRFLAEGVGSLRLDPNQIKCRHPSSKP